MVAQMAQTVADLVTATVSSEPMRNGKQHIDAHRLAYKVCHGAGQEYINREQRQFDDAQARMQQYHAKFAVSYNSAIQRLAATTDT